MSTRPFRVIARLTPEEHARYCELQTAYETRTWTKLIRVALRRYEEFRRATDVRPAKMSDNKGPGLTADRASDKSKRSPSKRASGKKKAG